MPYLLHHLLIESAQRAPEKVALRFQGQELSYGQLDRLSNQVAWALRSAGVNRGDRVGIFVRKSMASIISIFGILKAGCVYVPLDPGAPAARLAFITRNCDIRVLLTGSSMLPDVSQIVKEGSPLKTLVMTASDSPMEDVPGIERIISWDEVLAFDVLPPPPSGAIETDLAYILYTSGSTGDPKGVMIAHRTIFTFIDWCHETFRMTAEDRVTSHAPLHFDLSTFDIFVTIKAGGTVVLVPERLSVFPVQLTRLLQDERITVTYLVPSVLTLMVSYGQLTNHDLSSLRLVLFAGEVFPVKYLRALVTALPLPGYFNLYGPTETNVCTYYKVQPADVADDQVKPVPIGVACENMEVFAVDAEGGLVREAGVEGELWVRGSCVAQGYWGSPEATNRSFVRNQFQPYFDETAYRTGDIVTLAADGRNWIFVGRRDHLIKSRGYRIELNEIEASLYSHPDVKEAVAVAIPDELIGNRLQAFVVPSNGHDLTEAELRAHCGLYVPAYMVPESIHFLDELPKTTSGKVNRTLLTKLAAEGGG